MSTVPYFLGCPVWACDRWEGSLYTRSARRDEWLRQYSQVFNTVEGNSTFYGLPAASTVSRWMDTSEPGFRFVLKFPRAISHERRLIGAGRETEEFLSLLAQLHEAQRLGPTFLQLPRGFSAHHLEDLRRYLAGLPPTFHYAVEVRHADFFEGGKSEEELNALLTELHVDRVIFDSRPLFSGPPEDDAERASQGRKPRLPVHTTLTARHPLLRLVGRNDLRRVVPWIHEWVPVVSRWIACGVQPFVFTHTPDEAFAPRMARLFHEELVRHAGGIPAMRPWPGESEPSAARQLELF